MLCVTYLASTWDVWDASERKMQFIFNTNFLFQTAICRIHSEEVTYPFVAV